MTARPLSPLSSQGSSRALSPVYSQGSVASAPSSPIHAVFRKLKRKLSPKSSPDHSQEIVPVADVSTSQSVLVKTHSTKSLSINPHAPKRSDLERVFNFFDEDGDGKISPEELQSCVRTIGGELSSVEAVTAVESLDSDGDGLLGLEDFEKLMQANGEEEQNKDLREAFGMYEMEGSGCITPTSLNKMLSRLGESKTIEQCQKIIRAFDLNGDGVLNFEEFQVMMK